MNFRENIAASFAAKPSSGPSLKEAKAINKKRLEEKQAALAARIKTLIETLSEQDVDSWASQLDEAEKKRFSARMTGISALLKTNFLTSKKA